VALAVRLGHLFFGSAKLPTVRFDFFYKGGRSDTVLKKHGLVRSWSLLSGLFR